MEENDKEKGAPDKELARILREIELSRKTEDNWRTDAEHALDVYRSDVRLKSDERKEYFNILWSNVETKRPALYSATPRPDVRQKWGKKDPIARAIAEITERAVTCVLDVHDFGSSFDDVMVSAVNDMLLTGRAVTRIKYEAEFGEMPEVQENEDSEEDDGSEMPESTPEVKSEKVSFEQVQYDDFVRGPGKTYSEVPFIAFRHKLSKPEVEDKWPDFANELVYDITIEEDKDKKQDDETGFKRALIWEVWDREDRKVKWIAESYKDAFLSVDDDPLDLAGFYPIPKPLHAIEDPASLVPICEYSQYEVLAKELEHITRRIKHIVSGLRIRGIYDSTMSEMSNLFAEQDNGFIPAENLSRLVESGGLDKFIWTLPIDKYAPILMQLYQYRDGVIQQIYQITGISDVQRGSTNPNETKGAQELKASFGSQRLQRQQKAVQVYARDLIRLAVDVMTDKYSRETIASITGMDFPTAEQQQMAQMLIRQTQVMMQQPPQMPGQPPAPPPQIPPQVQQQIEQAQQVLAKPSWEAIEEVMKSDMRRQYRVDIETDSTIAADIERDKQEMGELLNGIASYLQQAVPAVQMGILAKEVNDKMFMAMIRKFKLGKEVEDAVEEQANQPMKPDPAVEAQKQQAQQQQQADMAKQQAEQQKQQFEMQKLQAETQATMQELQMKMQAMQAEHQMKMETMQADRQMAEQRMFTEQQKIEAERQKAAIKSQADQESAVINQIKNQQKLEVMSASKE